MTSLDRAVKELLIISDLHFITLSKIIKKRNKITNYSIIY